MLHFYNPQENLSSEVPDDILYPVPTKLAASTSSVLGHSCLTPPAFGSMTVMEYQMSLRKTFQGCFEMKILLNISLLDFHAKIYTGKTATQNVIICRFCLVS